jgi:DNA phosphorothioation-associated putative methyltransferase
MGNIQREVNKTLPAVNIKSLYEKHRELFDDYWETILDLGRIPAGTEFEFSQRLRSIAGSYKKAFDVLLDIYGQVTFQQAQQARKNDLSVYFALMQFGKRKAYAKMPESLKRDIKAFFTTYHSAIEDATKILYSVGDPVTIETRSVEAFNKFNIGEFNEGHSWIIPKQLLTELPPELRIYVECAKTIYGEFDSIHLVKIHFTSGKVTLLKYDDFEKDVPMLIKRVKIRIRDLDADIFDYQGKFEPVALENKRVFVGKDLEQNN